MSGLEHHGVSRPVRKVAKGGRYITSTLADKLAFEIERKTSENLHESLSDREYQVMCMIASGKTVKEIAEILTLSVKTVSTHRMHILAKLRLRNNAELARFAVEHQLLGR